MLAAAVDVGDVFPRAQCLDRHKLGGFQMVWFHPGNRMRRDPAGGRLLPDTGSADGHGVPDSSLHDRERAQHVSYNGEGPSGFAPDELDDRHHQSDDSDRKGGQQRYPDGRGGAFRAAALRRAVIQERKREKPHDSRGPAENDRDDEGTDGDP